MMRFTKGNLLKAEVEALVNTVNTVGVMGKGIALMFKESFPANYIAYANACRRKEIQTGRMFVQGGPLLVGGPKWLINFPTKQHWRNKTKIEWIEEGLDDLVRIILEQQIKSIAIPALGCGNGGLDWSEVRAVIECKLASLRDVEILIFVPTDEYQNVTR